MTARKLEATAVGIPAFEVAAPADGEVFALTSHTRAREALIFGLSVKSPGFNIFVLGADRSGRMTASVDYLERAVEDWPCPPDWLYLNNFKEPHRPRPVAVPAGEGRRFQARIKSLLPQLREALTRAFGGAEYEKQIVAESEQAQAQVGQQIEELRKEAKGKGLDISQTPQGFTIFPVSPDGKPLKGEEITAEERAALEPIAKTINEKLRDIRRYAAQQQMKLADKVENMNRQVAENAVGGLMDEIEEAFAAEPELVNWLKAMRTDILEDISRFRSHPSEDGASGQGAGSRTGGVLETGLEAPERRYAVNLLVDRQADKVPNVEIDPNPSMESLFGYIEYRQTGGVLETDFSMIRAGALHRANGGVMILRAESLATVPGLWPALKACLRDRKIALGNPLRQGIIPIAGAPQPEPIPLDIKLVLVGAPQWYYTFFSVDPDFQTHFRIKADVDNDMEASTENLAQYAGLIAAMAKDYGGLGVEPAAVGRLLGMAARWAADRRRLTAQFERVEDAVREAAHLLDPPCKGSLTLAAVDGALLARRERNARIEDRLHEQIVQGTVMIDVTGHVQGQVNALTVMDTGDHAFGIPSRVTARAFIGRRGVINVERDIAMSGPIQQKGAMVVQGLLAGRFARRYPLSFNCSITFEQNYGGVEGDSASLAELIAILSDLSGLPVRQDLGITGSVNQHGDSQAIGGVHHKVEGFFRTCCDRRALTGSQGVVIPKANEDHLVLRNDVTAAIAAGQFHIWSVDSIDEAVELFLETPAGVPDDTGAYPEGTVYGRVAAELERFDKVLRQRDAGD